MKIQLKDIPDAGLDIGYEEDPRQLGLVEDRVGFEDKIAIHGKLFKTGDAVSLSGWLTTRLILQCSRCLKSFPFPLYLELVTQFLPLVQAAGQKLDEDSEDVRTEESELYFYRGESLQLDDLIKEEIVLSIPMQPLCDPDCQGLCSRCGQDLNLQICGCRQKETAFG